MDFLHLSASRFHPANPRPTIRTPQRRRFFAVRSSLRLPFPEQNAPYYKELEAAVGVVEKACRLCIDVKKTLFLSDGSIIEKKDESPVTIADFGVQALVSLEMSKLFPSIPLVAEEDSKFVRSNNLVDAVVNVVRSRVNSGNTLTQDEVLEAIDRGGQDAYTFGREPATYWVLDPIDGTKGFVKGSDALYVVGLALIVDGEIVLGVMGCPNWKESLHSKSTTTDQEDEMSGILMISHIGCGTWSKRLWFTISNASVLSDYWNRCLVDDCEIVSKARFCIPESQTWESLPLSVLFSSTTEVGNVGDKEILLLPTCCGSLCKYLLVASGRASVFIQRTRDQKLIKSWDHAVGIICVLEAGGKVTDWTGNQIDFSEDQVGRRIIYPSGGVLVTNDRLHKLILGIISSDSLANI